MLKLILRIITPLRDVYVKDASKHLSRTLNKSQLVNHGLTFTIPPLLI